MHSNEDSETRNQMSADSGIGERTYLIGEVAKMIGSKVRTIRYYDEIGLVKPTSHTEGGHRLYTGEDTWRLELTSTLRYLDFSIEEISKLLSGVLSVDKALDWQIESLSIQVSALTNMISILQQAKQQQGDSMRHLYDFVQAKASNVEKRNQFIAEKVVATGLFDEVPSEWQDPMLHYFNKYIVNQEKTTAQQIAAWNELQEIINDTQFIQDVKNTNFSYFTKELQPRYDAATWIKKLDHIYARLTQALEAKKSADSPEVQAIIEETVSLYAITEQTIYNADFLKAFFEHAEQTRSPLIERINRLCAIMSPQLNLLSEGNHVFFENLQRKLNS
ncbi:MerR family transcriptional regulator [Paenibacillus paeoniae]|uniref:MerR family transcriptional regulator n=1 Tax=Paenibacillus paeoniae TaxID=2292705 RepID=A0A371PH38_9BACL|nr:MerR family transcriptional regulator [Paenibacillus paeoniae]REK75184.1 MerR family transcriptional regulator [Paenibacillus paeoniae]